MSSLSFNAKYLLSLITNIFEESNHVPENIDELLNNSIDTWVGFDQKRLIPLFEHWGYYIDEEKINSLFYDSLNELMAFFSK